MLVVSHFSELNSVEPRTLLSENVVVTQTRVRVPRREFRVSEAILVRVIEVQVERTNGGPPSAPPPVHAGTGIGATIP